MKTKDSVLYPLKLCKHENFERFKIPPTWNQDGGLSTPQESILSLWPQVVLDTVGINYGGSSCDGDQIINSEDEEEEGIFIKAKQVEDEVVSEHFITECSHQKTLLVEGPSLYAKVHQTQSKHQIFESDDYLFCNQCNIAYDGVCVEHPLILALNKPVMRDGSVSERALETMPYPLTLSEGRNETGVFTKEFLPPCLVFGPYEGRLYKYLLPGQESGCGWKIEKHLKNGWCVDGYDKSLSNWLCYVRFTTDLNKRNLVAFQYKGQIYYKTVCSIERGSELLVWYEDEYKADESYSENGLIQLDLKSIKEEEDEQDHIVYIKEEAEENEDELEEDEDVEGFVGTAEEGVDDSNDEDYIYGEHAKRPKHRLVKPFPGGCCICDICNRSFKSSYHLKIHRQCHSNKRYECDVCHKRYSRLQTFVSHKLKHKESSYSCTECSVDFAEPSAYTAHMREHTGTVPFVCDVCSAEFMERILFEKHKMTHLKRGTGVNSTKFECDVCQKTFATKTYLRCHRNSHFGELLYECDICGKKYAHATHLTTHKRTHGERQHECEDCGHKFFNWRTLKVHMYKHTGEKPFKCEVCNKCFNQRSILRRHRVIHTGEKQFVCDECGKPFSESANLRRHKQVHARRSEATAGENGFVVKVKRRFLCDICGKSFTYAAVLKAHKRTHTGEKPYKCNSCDKSYAYAHNLISHRRTHTGEKPYQCDVCGKAFTYRNTLKGHRRRHTGEKPYECDICSERFMFLYQRNHHKLSCAIKTEIVDMDSRQECSFFSQL